VKFVFIFPLSVLFFLISAFLFDSAVLAADPAQDQPPSEYFLICRNEKTVRTLRVEKTQQRCNSVYTKNGQDQTIGSALKTYVCIEVVNKVKETLENAGWKCKQVKEGLVSHLKETEAQAIPAGSAPSAEAKQKR